MWVERISRVAVLLVLLAATLAVLGGFIMLLWNPVSASPVQPQSVCANPPCFGGDGPPRVTDLPVVVPVALLGAAALLGGLCLLAVLVARRHHGGRRRLALAALATVGPVLVLVGGEVVPHVLSPCAPAALWGAEPPRFCVRSSDGWDVPDRWHALDHALVGFVPLSVALAWWWRRVAVRDGDPRPSDGS